MNKSYHNIESRKLMPSHNYRVGYKKSTDDSIRIYQIEGQWRVDCKAFNTLAEVSAYLETL